MIAKKLPFFLSLLFLSIINGYSQNVSFEWAKLFEGKDIMYSYDMVLDPSGNIYSVGSFKDTVDFDPGTSTNILSATGSYDIYISKLNKNGDFIWARKIGGSGYDQASSITMDDSGNLYITGHFYGTVDFDPGMGTSNLTSEGDWDCYILKLNSSGNFLWSKRFGGKFNDQAYSITLDQLGNIYATGLFMDTVDFDPSLAINALISSADADIFIAKWDNNGNYIWTKQFEGAYEKHVLDIGVDLFNNVYTTGYFKSSMDVDPDTTINNLSSSGKEDAFLTKLHSNGSFLWSKKIGGLERVKSNALVLDTLGNIFITGSFNGTTEFNSGSTTGVLLKNGLTDMFIAKYNNNGSYQWVKQFSGNNAVIGNDIILDTKGDIYVTGGFGGTVDFHPGSKTMNLTSNGIHNVFVNKISATGIYLWAKAFTGTGSNQGNAIALDDTGSVYTLGGITNYTDFDPGAGVFALSPIGTLDGFIQKMSLCPLVTDTIAENVCFSYTSPSGHHLWTLSGQYLDTLSTMAGCDSVLTINLQVTNIDTSIGLAGNTFTAHDGNSYYKWLDCDNGYAIIPNAFGKYFTPSNNGNYAVELTRNGCVDTSRCMAVSTIGLLEQEMQQIIRVYPNPTLKSVSLDLGKPYKDIKVSIRNVYGQLISQHQYPNGQIVELNLEGSIGFYYIIVTTLTGENATLKVLKEN